jgi:hypothetical protein
MTIGRDVGDVDGCNKGQWRRNSPTYIPRQAGYRHISSVISGSVTDGIDVYSYTLSMRGSHNRPRDGYQRGKVRRHKR